MPIDFLKRQKRQKYLLPLAIAVVAVAGTVLWFGYFRKGGEPPLPIGTTTGVVLREIKIDFSVLESPLLRELQPFVEIPLFDGEKGRQNPFLPY